MSGYSARGFLIKQTCVASNLTNSGNTKNVSFKKPVWHEQQNVAPKKGSYNRNIHIAIIRPAHFHNYLLVFEEKWKSGCKFRLPFFFNKTKFVISLPTTFEWPTRFHLTCSLYFLVLIIKYKLPVSLSSRRNLLHIALVFIRVKMGFYWL